MRTTVTLEDDVASAVERIRREEGIGLSEAINRLARAGLIGTSATPPFRQRTASLGLRIDVSDIAEAIELLEGPTTR
jgi:ribbon-helix-helix CopG family protein